MDNLNDAYLDVLSTYSGSVDDRRKAYLMDYLNYTKDTTLNDLEWDVLQSLGYKNSLTDAWLDHIKSLGGMTLSDKGRLLSSTFYGSSAFSPSSLFSASEQGVWYDPSDLTTLFQDTAGTTPVTATGQTVGLMLDKSKRLALGSEQAPVSSFVFSNTAGGGGPVTDTSNVPAGTYRVTFTISNWVQGGLLFRLRTTGGAVLGAFATANSAGNGVFTAILTTNAAAQRVELITPGGAASPATMVVSGYSVKELAGNHATQATTASRPIYGINPITGTRNLLLATDTMATQSRTVTAAAHTLSFTGTGTVTLTGASIAGPLVGTGAGNRVSLTFTPTAASLTMTVAGSVTFAQLELGSTATAYQRVTNQYNVTEAGVASAHYLFFDGGGDVLVSPTFTLTGAGPSHIFVGSFLNTTALLNQGVVNYGSSNFNTARAIDFDTPTTLKVDSGNNAIPQITFNPSVANIFEGRFGPSVDGAVNGGTFTTTGVATTTIAGTYKVGTGIINTQPTHQMYGLIAVHRTLTTTERNNTVTWLNGKTGAYA